MADYIDMIETQEGNLPLNYDALVNKPMVRVNSPDPDNPVYLRDLESGYYILSGKFRPYNGSTRALSFSSSLPANIIRSTSKTSVQIFYPVNNCVQFLEITDDSYTPNYVYLNDLQGDEVIIKSSTAGSSKRFKITVDDAGTLSATEVV